MLSSDGMRYKTDVADTRQLLRMIQSILSPKAEPFKLWLAGERIEETIDPELTIERALAIYKNAPQLNQVVTGMIEGVTACRRIKFHLRRITPPYVRLLSEHKGACCLLSASPTHSFNPG